MEDSLAISEQYKSAYSNNKKDLTNRIYEFQELIKKANGVGMSQNWIQDKLVYRLGQDYSRIGDFDRALEINSSLIQHFDSITDYVNLVWVYVERATYHNNQRDYTKVKLAYENGLNVAKQHKISERLIDLYNGLASVSIHLNDLVSAKKYVSLVEKRLPYYAEDDIDEVRAYFNITKAEYYLALNNNERSEKFYLKAITIADQLEYRKVANARTDLAKLYLDTDENEKALIQLNKVLKHFGADTNTKIKDTYLIEAYYVLAKVYFYEGELENSLEMVVKSKGQIDYFHNKYVFATSKLFLDEMKRQVMELGLEIEFQSYENTGNQRHLLQALLYADQAKSNVLNERMQLANLVNSSAISQETRDLRFKWVYQLNQYETSGNNDEAIKLRNRVESLDKALGLRKQQTFGPLEFENLQSSLLPNQLVLQYFVINDDLYIFQISKDKVKLLVKNMRSDEVIKFYQNLQNPKSTLTEYNKSGEILYNQLIGQLAIDKAVNHLIIIPDKSLTYLVFGALPTKSLSNWSSTEYLGDKYTISYNFSLHTLAQKSINTSTSYAGFAPTFDATSTLSYISGNDEAVTQAKSFLGGKTYTGANATTQMLREEAVSAAVLQLYTHAVSSDSSFDASYIYLQDRKMYVDEILTLPLKTKLCILTACEVGLGKEYDGEGVTGVSWAFRAAGADNVIQSLWRINQESSRELMDVFFKRIADGESSEVALQMAKRDYMNNDEISERLKHPFYWAGITHYGKGTIVESGKVSFGNYLVLGVPLCLGVFLLSFLKRKRS